jgi:hypothetical protein
MSYYVTKYALTSGLIILSDEDVQVFNDNPELLKAKWQNKKGEKYTDYFHKPDWHTSREDAKLRIIEMINKKVLSLEKQKQKLLSIDVDSMLDKN